MFAFLILPAMIDFLQKVRVRPCKGKEGRRLAEVKTVLGHTFGEGLVMKEEWLDDMGTELAGREEYGRLEKAERHSRQGRVRCPHFL